MVEHVRGALLADELASAPGATGANDGEAGRHGKLHRGDSHGARCSVHQHGLTGMRVGAEKKCAVGGGIWYMQARSLCEGDLLG